MSKNLIQVKLLKVAQNVCVDNTPCVLWYDSQRCFVAPFRVLLFKDVSYSLPEVENKGAEVGSEQNLSQILFLCFCFTIENTHIISPQRTIYLFIYPFLPHHVA